MVDFMIQGLMFGLLGFLWSTVLTAPGGIFNFLQQWYWKAFGDPCNPSPTVVGISIGLFDCYNCVAGQFALWGYVMLNFNQYDPVVHLATIALSITAAYFLGQIDRLLDIKRETRKLHEQRKRSR